MQPRVEDKSEIGFNAPLRGDLGDQMRGEERLRLTLDSIPALLHSAEVDGSLDYFNQRWLDYLGVSLHEITGWRWISKIHPDDADALLQQWRSSLETGEPLETEARVRRQDGAYRWMLHRKVPLRDAQGKVIKWYGSSIDIDDLKRSEFYLAEGQRLSHTGSWVFNRAGFDHWSPELFRIHGLDPSDKAPSLEEYLALVHAEDREYVLQTVQKMFAEGARFDFTKRIVRPDGEIRCIRCVGVPATCGGTSQGFVGMGIDVTEQERILGELKRSEFYLAEGQRLGHAGSWSFKPDGTCDYWSRELYEILGFDPKNGIPTISDYLTRIHPEDREVVESTLQRMVATGEGCDLKKRIIRPDGAQRVIRCVGMPVRENGVVARFVGTLMDITEQEQLTQQLRNREACLAEAQRLSHTGSFEWNVVSGERTWSDENYRILDYDRSIKPTFELVRDRVHPDDLQMWEEAFARASAGKQVDFEHRLLMPDGSVKHLQVVAYGVQKDGRFVELVGTAMDITERKRAEAALQEARAELEGVTRVTTMGELAASIAHEINQPLSGVVTSANAGLNWLAANPPNLSKTRETLERILRDGTRGGEVLARIRALLKRAPPAKTLVNVNQVVRDVLGLTAGEVRQHQIELSLDLASTVPPVLGDAVQLQQVLLNLIKNAIEAMAGMTNGQRTLRIQSYLGELDAKPAVTAEVSDTGVGFSGTDHSRLFEAFHTTKPQGMGMGLWISRSIIENHHGRLTASPNDGPGATFVIILPRAEQEQA